MSAPGWLRWALALAVVLAVAVGGAMANMALLSSPDTEPAVGGLNARDGAPAVRAPGTTTAPPTRPGTTTGGAAAPSGPPAPGTTTREDDDRVRTDDDDRGKRDANGDRIDSDLRPDEDDD
ncbi:MAG: hypothetical protein RIB67_11290 [Miltoncostaeaceae bacterium]